MIHGELTGNESFAAVIAKALVELSHPPLGLPEFTGLSSLFFDMGWICRHKKIRHGALYSDLRPTSSPNFVGQESSSTLIYPLFEVTNGHDKRIDRTANTKSFSGSRRNGDW